MCLERKRLLFFLLSYLTCFALYSQTLYWVGGSGNFNDPRHWSLSPNGNPGQITPNASSDLVFTNGDLSGKYEVFFSDRVKVNSVTIRSTDTITFVQGLSPARLVIRSRFDNEYQNQHFNSGVVLEFANNSNGAYGFINTGASFLNADAVISSGKWTLSRIHLKPEQSLFVSNASVDFYHSSIDLGYLSLEDCGLLNFDRTIIKTRHEFKVKNCDNYKLTKASFNLKMYSDSDANPESLSSIAAKKGSSNLVNTACIATSSLLPSCSPGCDGILIITLSPNTCYSPAATLPYDILVDNTGCNGNPASVLGVGPGTYTLTGFCTCVGGPVVYVYDVNGNQLEGWVASFGTNGVAAGASAPFTSTIACGGSCTGTININYAGNPPYNHTVIPVGAPQYTTASLGVLTLTGQCAGTLTVMTIDASNCMNTFTRTFTAPPVLNTNSVVTNVACNGACTGSINISPTGGTAPYTVSFTPGGNFPVAAGGTVSATGLCVGAVTATLTDFRNCKSFLSANIVQPPALGIAVTNNSIACSGACTASAAITVTGGVSPYTFTIVPTSGPSTVVGPTVSLNLTNLCADTYTINLRDNSNCLITQTFAILAPPVFTAVTTVTNVSCPGGPCNGVAVVSASGGNGTPYNYTWTPNPPTGQGTATISNLCGISYTVNLTDAVNCTFSTVVNVLQPPLFTVTAVSQTISCFGSCNGSSTITALGGNGAPFTYSWSPNPPSGQGTNVISNLCGGTSFTATVSDASLCATTITLGVAQASSITPNITTSSITCSGLCNGSITASPTGTATFNYTLVSSAGTTVTGMPPFTGLCAANYTLLVRNMSTSCVQSFTTAIIEPNPLMGSIVSTSISCFNQCNGTLAGNVLGGTPGYTLNWFSSPGSPTVAASLSNQCAGTYSLTITDANGCTSNTATATLLQPSDFTITINPTNVNCFSDCNGALAANISGATPGYTLAWSNGWPLNPATNLCVGNYSLTVTDARGCVRTVSATITAPSSVTINQFTANVSCSGGANGSATLIASGGTPGYTYQFNTLPVTTNTTGIITGLTQGAYLGSASDLNGCTQFVTFTISAPPLLSAAITGSSNSCNACTGAATVQASGGTPPYLTYVWTNSVNANVGNTPVATSLCPGDYTVTITDNSLCTTTQTVHIPLSVNITVVAGGTGIQCFGACTGSAVASPSGGNPGPGGYNYSWSPGGQVTQAATNLCAGVYVVTVSDVLGCSNTATYTVTQPTSLTATSSQTNATCSGTCNGIITTNVTGGTAPITYTWSPGSINTSSLTNLCAGTYTVQIRDANLCVVSLPVFTITENAPLTATFVATNPNACAVNNGSVCVTPGGGSGAGYTFSWSPVNGSANCLTGLTAGSYSVRVTDGALCSTVFSTLLINPTGPVLTVVSSSVNCFGGATGSATASVTGTGPFSFTWTPAVSSSSTSSSSTATGLAAGSYVLSSTDGNSCITTSIVTITQASSLTANAVVSNISCNGANNGSIVVAPTGGTPAYTFNWLPLGLPNSATVTGLSAGVYTLNITDVNLCSAPFTFTVSEPAALTLTNVATNVKCNAACNGSIIAGAAGGTGAISYSWSPVGAFTGSTTATVLNLCPNSYVVTAKDLNNCSISNTITITEPPVLTSTLVLQNATCSNSCNAVAVHQAAGGTPTYTFSWSLGPPGSATLSNLCAGNYVATITDANGCQVVKTFTVIPPAPFNINLTATSPACNSICSGSIASTISGAQGGVTFNWSPSGSGQNPTGLCPANYSLLAVDANGCEAVAFANLINPPQLMAGLSTTNAACNSNCNGAAISTPSNATGAVSYTWLPAGPNTPSLTNLCPGDYTVHLKDAAGCEIIQTFTLLNPPPLVINPSTNPSTCGQTNGVISATASGGTPGYTYNWLPPLSSSNPVVTGLGAGIFTLVVSDVNSCTTSIVIPLSNSNGPSAAPVISTSVNCNAQCTGAASVDVSTIAGGTPTYNVTWLAPAPSSVNPLVNLCAGNYTAQITDANGCILFTGVNILEPPAVVLNPSFGVPSCNGTCDGSISLNPTGGMSPSFSYTWFPSGPNAPVITNACAATYTVLIGDNGCTYTQNVTLPSQLNIMASTSVTLNQCFGDCNAVATVFNAFGGAPPYSFSWSNGQVGTTATNLCNGTYSVIVTDANGCFNIFPVVVGSSSQLVSTVAIASPSCGLCNGASTITPSGGTAPYLYNWTSGSTLATASNLCAGLYQVVITDNAGCKLTETVTINSSSGITGESFTVQGLPCAGTCNGAATVTAIGGTAPISYNWISPATSGSVISSLCSGTYFVQMIDAQGCLRTSSVDIDPVTTVSISAFITAPGCGLSNGAIDVLISGGTPSYAISWSPPIGVTASVTGVGQGSYTISVTESGPNNCTVSQQINVSNTSGPTVTATQSNIRCFNACTGSITTVASGTATPFTYNWSVGGNASSISNLCKGVVTLSVTDVNNCVSINSYTILDNPQLQSGLPTLSQPSCGLCNGAANLNVFGGTLPYTYTWTTGATGANTSSLCAGLYQVQITDNLGCQQTETVVINNSNGIAGETFSIQGLPCAGTCNGGATVTAIGGTAPIVYTWLNPAVNGPSISNLCDGTYFVQMSDAQGCLRTSSVVLNPVTTLSIAASIIPPGCGQNNGAVTVSINGGTPAYLVSWAPVANSTPTLNGIGQGSYTITVTESGPNTCTLSQQINVSNTSGPTVTATQSDINCFGTCTGSISTVVSGTATPFTYNWSTGSNASSVGNLCKGVVTLTVTDANNCVSIVSYTITDHPQLQAGVPAVTQPSCGLCNGTANLNALGGTLPYTYTWTTGANGPSVTNLCAGLYQVQITDNLGCQQTETVIINNSNGIAGENFSIQGLPCNATCNGAATVTAVGGTAPIVYNWINPVTTGSVISGLCAGTYFVQMTDAQGCIRTSSVDIDALTTLSISATSVEPGCQLTNGSITVLISGGTPSYSVVWSPVAGSTPTLSGIGQGSYTVTVTESGPNTCTLSQQITLSNVNGPTVTASQTDINCFGTCNGAVSVATTGTATPFAYNWNIGGTAPVVTNLCPGVITLSVTDANNCVSIETYTINENPPLQMGVPQITQPGCNMCNGAAVVNPFGGSLPYSVVWTTGGTGPSISNLCAGLYQVLITDNLGCQQTENVVINNVSGITGETFIVQDEVCSNTCNGSATVTAVGGTAPIKYNWINPPVASQVVTNLCAGTYFVQMTDNNGCIRTASTLVNSIPGFTFTPVIKKPTCGVTDGSIDVTVTGGLPPYTYTWLPGASSSSVLTNIGPGTYTLLINDNTTCTKMQVFNISNLTAPAITFTQNNIACFNACTGSISAVASGSASPFTYNWSVGGSLPTVSNLCKGLVTLTVTASDGCIAVRSFTLTDNPDLELSLPHLVEPGCVGACNGEITLIPSGGSLPYTFSWQPTGNGNPSTGLCAGNYSVIITDSKGCMDTARVLLDNPPPIAVTTTITNASCSSVADGAIAITVNGGTPAYTFTWSGPASFSSSSQNITNVLAGTYSLSMADSQGCSSDTLLVLAPTITITAIAGNDTIVCPAGSVVLSGTNSAGVAQFSWFLLPNNVTPVANTSSFTIPNAIGSATYELLTVASVSSCVARDTVVVDVFPEIQLDAGQNVLIPIFSTVTIGGNPTAGSVVTLTWSPAMYLNDATIANPVASNTISTLFTVEASDANGCRASDTVRVDLYPEVRIPNGFTPNADGRNDSWIIDYIDQFPDNTVEVYNRWGEQLFYSKGYGTPFNGTYRGKNLPVGTYYYIIHLNHPAYTKPYTGPLTIFR